MSGKFGSLKGGRDFGLRNSGAANDAFSLWSPEDADEMFRSIFGPEKEAEPEPEQLNLFEGGAS
jgi:hypothetical protein